MPSTFPTHPCQEHHVGLQLVQAFRVLNKGFLLGLQFSVDGIHTYRKTDSKNQATTLAKTKPSQYTFATFLTVDLTSCRCHFLSSSNSQKQPNKTSHRKHFTPFLTKKKKNFAWGPLPPFESEDLSVLTSPSWIHFAWWHPIQQYKHAIIRPMKREGRWW